LKLTRKCLIFRWIRMLMLQLMYFKKGWSKVTLFSLLCAPCLVCFRRFFILWLNIRGRKGRGPFVNVLTFLFVKAYSLKHSSKWRSFGHILIALLSSMVLVYSHLSRPNIVLIS
jgi:hypothetical protein